ncbi:MAG: filamentous hemagglutinin N-terminal domain-containing protein [Tepidisphaeraceae bacterium]
MSLWTSSALAIPKGAQVVAGQASIVQTGSELIVRAASNSIINFQSFNISSGESVVFIEPSASSRVLDRVTGPGASFIDGSLQANGQVYLVNPQGIFIGPSGVVNVAGLVAVGGSIADSDFLSGNNHFTGLTGAVSNSGTIRANSAYLVGSQILNSGTINGAGGCVVMAAGSDVYVGQPMDGLFVKVAPQAVANQNTSGVGDVYSLALSNTGSVKASNIVLNGQGGGVQVSGSLDASTSAAGAKGGQVIVTGGTVALNSATVNASGPSGGGTIKIGGDLHGNSDIPAADTASVSSDSTLTADALTDGAGGQIVVWSSSQTDFAGQISARGAGSGVGGDAEISSKNELQFTGSSNLAGPGGSGTLLFDPANVTIETNGTQSISENISSTNATAPSDISVTSLVALLHTQNVGIEATGTITIASPINDTSDTNSLVLSAPSIVLNAGITLNGGMFFEPLNGGAGTISISMPPGSPANNIQFTSNSGSIVFGDAVTCTADLGVSSTVQVSFLGNLTATGSFYSGGTGALVLGSPGGPALTIMSGNTGESNNSFGSFGPVHLNSNVTLETNSNLSAPNSTSADGKSTYVQFNSTLDGPGSLTVSPKGADTIYFYNPVGANVPLGALTINIPAVQGWVQTNVYANVTTTGDQNYGTYVVIPAPQNTGQSITIASTTGSVDFHWGTNTQGAPAYAINATEGIVNNGTVPDFQSLTLLASKTVTINGAVAMSQTSALSGGSLTVDATLIHVNNGAGISTTGNMVFWGPVILESGESDFFSSYNASVAFQNGISPSTASFGVNADQNLYYGGSVTAEINSQQASEVFYTPLSGTAPTLPTITNTGSTPITSVPAIQYPNIITAPSLSIPQPAPSSPGDFDVSITLVADDTANDDPVSSWTVNWGDKTSSTVAAAAENVSTLTSKTIVAHDYSKAGTYEISAQAVDEQNDKPSVSPISISLVNATSNVIQHTSSTSGSSATASNVVDQDTAIETAVAALVVPTHSSAPVSTKVKLSAAAMRDLQDLGINTHEASETLQTGVFTSISIIDDVPPPSEANVRAVSVSRLDGDRVRDVLDNVYRPIFYSNGKSRREEIKSELAEAISRFRGGDSGKPVDPAEFALYVHANATAPEGLQVAADVQSMSNLSGQIDTLGLNSAEALQSKTYWTSHVTPTGLGLPPRWLLNVLEASRNSK